MPDSAILYSSTGRQFIIDSHVGARRLAQARWRGYHGSEAGKCRRMAAMGRGKAEHVPGTNWHHHILRWPGRWPEKAFHGISSLVSFRSRRWWQTLSTAAIIHTTTWRSCNWQLSPAKPKGSICLLAKWADTAFWLCTADAAALQWCSAKANSSICLFFK